MKPLSPLAPTGRPPLPALNAGVCLRFVPRRNLRQRLAKTPAKPVTGRRVWMLLFLLAVIVRLGLALALDAGRWAQTQIHHEHPTIARHLALGEGFRFNFFGRLDRPPVLTSQQAPLVPYVLAGSYRLFGIESPASFQAMIGLQILISALTVLMLAHITHLIFQSRVLTLLVGLACSFYPPMVISPLHVQALVWNLFWLTALLWTTYQIAHRPAWGPRVLFVVAALGGLHTDPILAAVIGILLCYLAIITFFQSSLPTRPAFMAGVAPVAIMGLCIGLGLVPWTVRNYNAHGRLIFIKDSLPYVFWQGNNKISVGTDKCPVPMKFQSQLQGNWNPWQALAIARQARQQAQSVNACLTVPQIEYLQSLPNEIQRMDTFARWAREDFYQNPFGYLTQCGRRLYAWLWIDITNPRSFLLPYQLSYAGLLLLSAIGIFFSPALGWKNLSRLSPLLLTAGTLTAVHVLIITSARFRIPFEMLLLLPASAGVQVLGVGLVQMMARLWRSLGVPRLTWTCVPARS